MLVFSLGSSLDKWIFCFPLRNSYKPKDCLGPRNDSADLTPLTGWLRGTETGETE